MVRDFIRPSKICPNCGIEYTPNSNNQKYCSFRCKDAVMRAKDRKRPGADERNKLNRKMPSLDSLSKEDLLHYGRVQSNYYLKQ